MPIFDDFVIGWISPSRNRFAHDIAQLESSGDDNTLHFTH